MMETQIDDAESAIAEHNCFTLNPRVKKREEDFGGILWAGEWLSVDEIGMQVLREFDGRKTLRDVAEKIAAFYEVGCEQVVADLNEFASAMTSRQVLIRGDV